jgi:dienelactone hydrolase
VPIQVQCSGCGKKLAAPEKFAGKTVKCPACQTAVAIPAAASASPAVEAKPSADKKTAAVGTTAPLPSPKPAASPKASAPPDAALQQPAPKPASAMPRTPANRQKLYTGVAAAAAILGALIGVIGVHLFPSRPAGGTGSLPGNVATRPPINAAAGDDTAPLPIKATVDVSKTPRPTGFVQAGPGIEVATVALAIPGGGPGQRNTLWIYKPEGPHAPHSLGCIFIAPAGAPVFAGNVLGDGDREEHLPYVKAGYVVVALEIDGPYQSEQLSEPLVKASFAQFLAASGGLVNGANAIQYVLATMPEVEPGRLYVAGHSSAATFALLFAEHEPRIKACIAYAPLSDLSATVRGQSMAPLMQLLPGLSRLSPQVHAKQLTCPLFLFHAENDTVVPIDVSRKFLAKVKETNAQVTFRTVPMGDHHDSMIGEGIPRALQWLATLPAEQAARPSPRRTEQQVAGGSKPPSDSPTQPADTGDQKAGGNVAPSGNVVPGFPPPGATSSPLPPMTGTEVSRPPGHLRASSNDFEMSFSDYLVKTYARWLGDDRRILDSMRWFAAGKRPVLGLRWGVGLYVAQQPHGGEIHMPQMLTPFIGTAGSSLVAALAERIDKDTTAGWPSPKNSQLSRVPMFFANSEDDLIKTGAAHQADALVAIVITGWPLWASGAAQSNLEMRLIDVISGTTLWKSPRLSSPRAAGPRSVGRDAASGLLKSALKKLDALDELSTMPVVSESVAAGRVKKLSAGDPSAAARLRAVVEIRYYELKKLIPAEAARRAYQQLISDEFAEGMESGSAEDRTAALDAWAHRP